MTSGRAMHAPEKYYLNVELASRIDRFQCLVDRLHTLQGIQDVRVDDLIHHQVSVGHVAHVLTKRQDTSAFGTQGMAAAISADSATAGMAGMVPLAIFHWVALAGSVVTYLIKSQAMSWCLLLGETVSPQPEVSHKYRVTLNGRQVDIIPLVCEIREVGLPSAIAQAPM